MSGFLLRSLTIIGGAISVNRTSVSTALNTIDGVVPTALGSGKFIGRAEWDETVRALVPIEISVSPESGSADDLDTINSSPAAVEGDTIRIWSTSGNTINVKHTTGNIRIAGGDRFDTIGLDGQWANVTFTFRGGSWCETSRSIIPNS